MVDVFIVPEGSYRKAFVSISMVDVFMVPEGSYRKAFVNISMVDVFMVPEGSYRKAFVSISMVDVFMVVVKAVSTLPYHHALCAPVSPLSLPYGRLPRRLALYRFKPLKERKGNVQELTQP